MNIDNDFYNHIKQLYDNAINSKEEKTSSLVNDTIEIIKKLIEEYAYSMKNELKLSYNYVYDMLSKLNFTKYQCKAFYNTPEETYQLSDKIMNYFKNQGFQIDDSNPQYPIIIKW